MIGGSDQGRQVIDALSTRDDHEVVGVLDGDLAGRRTRVGGMAVVGSTTTSPACAAPTLDADGFVVAIGDNATRGDLFERGGRDVPRR